jgi:hydrogenase maturation protease
MMASRPGVVVIGVGSEFRADDGIGPAVLAALSDAIPAGVALVASDGEPTRLVEAWTGAGTAIVVDAVVGSGTSPGALYRLDVRADNGGLPAQRGVSSHDLGVGSAIELARALGRMPATLIVHGMEGADFSHGVTMSPLVAGRIDDLTAAVLADIRMALAS